MKEIQFFTKSLLRFLALSFTIIIAAVLIFVFAMYSYIQQDNDDSNPRYVSSMIELDDALNLSDTSKHYLKEHNVGLLVLNESGDYLTSYYAPDELTKDYSALEVASFTRWYLKDYPVFSYIVDDKLLVFVYPKDSYTKFSFMYMKVPDFKFLLVLPFVILAVVFTLLFLIYYASKRAMNKEILPISNSIVKLSDNESIALEEKGQLKHIKMALNKTSQNLEHAQQQRNTWLRGISHDLRTPLTLISAHAQELSHELSNNKNLEVIELNAESISRTLDSLNMIYRLESEKGIEQKSTIDLATLVREISIDLLNSIDRDFTIELLDCERVNIEGDKNLLERAIRNVLLNSIYHNKYVDIRISLIRNMKEACLSIIDNGAITPERVEEIKSSDYSVNHANFGISILYKIISLHEGRVELSYNNPGLRTNIYLNLSK